MGDGEIEIHFGLGATPAKGYQRVCRARLGRGTGREVEERGSSVDRCGTRQGVLGLGSTNTLEGRETRCTGVHSAPRLSILHVQLHTTVRDDPRPKNPWTAITSAQGILAPHPCKTLHSSPFSSLPKTAFTSLPASSLALNKSGTNLALSLAFTLGISGKGPKFCRCSLLMNGLIFGCGGRVYFSSSDEERGLAPESDESKSVRYALTRLSVL